MLPLILPIIIGEKPAYQWLRRALVGLGGVLLLCVLIPELRPFVAVPGLGLIAAFLLFAILPSDAVFLLGEPLQLTPEGVQTGERFVASNELRSVQVDFAGYKGQYKGGRVPPHNGGGNQLAVELKNGGQVPPVQFFTSSSNHSRQLAVLLKGWRQAGIKVVANGLDLA